MFKYKRFKIINNPLKKCDSKCCISCVQCGDATGQCIRVTGSHDMEAININCSHFFHQKKFKCTKNPIKRRFNFWDQCSNNIWSGSGLAGSHDMV